MRVWRGIGTGLLVGILATGVVATTSARGAGIESNEAVFAWTPATGPVAYYGAWVSLNGEDFTENHDQLVDAPRVAVRADMRGTGLGREMMAAALDHIAAAAPGRPVRLGAQTYLEGFYTSFGFRTVSSVYDDGGIPHVDMERP